MKIMIDLCSGLGGASEAFRFGDEWIIYRIENNPLLQDVPHTHDFDVLHWMDWLPSLPHLDEADTVVVWASPPCTEFSDGYSGPKNRHRSEHGDIEDYNPEMNIFYACLDIIEYLEPDFWILENVRGSLPYFEPVIGGFRQQVHSFYLWGNFPHLNISPYKTHKKADVDTTSSNPLRANIKGKIPLHVSAALLRAIDSHTDLRQWM